MNRDEPAGSGPAGLRGCKERLSLPSLGRVVALVASSVTLAPAGGCAAKAEVGEQGGCLLGLSSTDGTGPADSLERLEQLLARRADLDRIYRQWENAVPGSREQETLAAGRIPVVSFNGQGPDGTIVPWASVARGEQDAHLTLIARGYRDLGSKVFVIYHQNPDKDLGQFGSAQDYREAYRHVVELFEKRGATNVVWTFTLRSPSFASDADQLFPGDDVVQWIGANAYNYSTESEGGRWISLRGLISDFLNWAESHEQLLMLAEWASTEDPRDSSRKAQWLEESLATVREQPRLRALVYYHRDSLLGIDSTPDALAAFRRIARDPYLSTGRRE